MDRNYLLLNGVRQKNLHSCSRRPFIIFHKIEKIPNLCPLLVLTISANPSLYSTKAMIFSNLSEIYTQLCIIKFPPTCLSIINYCFL